MVMKFLDWLYRQGWRDISAGQIIFGVGCFCLGLGFERPVGFVIGTIITLYGLFIMDD